MECRKEERKEERKEGRKEGRKKADHYHGSGRLVGRMNSVGAVVCR